MANHPLDEEGPKWPQIQATTLSDHVYQIIRNRILHRDLRPGTFIREQEVSDATGVSRTPVREALNRLATQEFLERVPHRGFRVPNNPWETLLDVYPIVTALEVLAGSLALEHLEEADVDRLRDLNQQMREAAESGDEKLLAELNNAFHHVLSERSSNQRLCELLDQLRAQVFLLDIWYYSVPEHIDESIDDHTKLITAIEMGDREEVLAALRTNYARGQRALEKEMNAPVETGGERR
ncbi:MAG: FCD domain-containing protein [Gemmatimonas sp.]|nr:FCD domain-containing protein [Gemmatimonas sp.]